MKKKNKNELKVLKELEKDKKELVLITNTVIKDIYTNIAESIEKELKMKGKNNFSERDLKKLEKKIKKELDKATHETKKNIIEAIKEITIKTIENNLNYYKEIDKKHNSKFFKYFSNKYKNVLEVVEDKIINGKLYKDNLNLSDRIWNSNRQNKKIINQIIKDGLKNKENIYDIALKLEEFVKPDRFKITKGAEYNSLRLAKTSINHAQHQAVIERAKNNKLITHIEWMSAHSSRVCPLCSQRDGKVFKKSDLPLDHPNGMCIIMEVQPEEEELIKILDDFDKSEYEDFDLFLDNY